MQLTSSAASAIAQGPGLVSVGGRAVRPQPQYKACSMPRGPQLRLITCGNVRSFLCAQKMVSGLNGLRRQSGQQPRQAAARHNRHCKGPLPWTPSTKCKCVFSGQFSPCQGLGCAAPVLARRRSAAEAFNCCSMRATSRMSPSITLKYCSASPNSRSTASALPWHHGTPVSISRACAMCLCGGRLNINLPLCNSICKLADKFTTSGTGPSQGHIQLNQP